MPAGGTGGGGTSVAVAAEVGTGAGLTVIVTCAVRTCVPQRAVRVYVVVEVGRTVVLPGVATPPMSLSISALSALLTKPQVSVDD